MRPLDRLRQELLNLERHLAVAGLALLDAEEVETADDVKMLLAAFGYRYKSMREFLREHGEVGRWHRGSSQVDLAHGMAHQSRPAEVKTLSQ